MGQSRYSWSYWWWSGFPHPYSTQGGPEILGGPVSLLMVLLVVEWLPSPLPHTRRPGDPRWASLVTHGPIGGGVAPPPHPTQGGPEILGGPVSLLMVLLVVEWLPSPLLHTRRPGDPRRPSLVTHGPIGGEVASLTPTPHKEARRF